MDSTHMGSPGWRNGMLPVGAFRDTGWDEVLLVLFFTFHTFNT